MDFTNVAKLNFLQGKKTYIIALITVAYGVFGFLSGNLTQANAIQVILGGLSVAFLRKGISNG